MPARASRVRGRGGIESIPSRVGSAIAGARRPFESARAYRRDVACCASLAASPGLGVPMSQNDTPLAPNSTSPSSIDTVAPGLDARRER